ncbi:MAG: DUF2304 family protein [Patescibacteria group bacterium]
MLFQIISLLLIILIVSRIVLRFVRHEIGSREFIYWILFWFLAAAAILTPDALTRIANILGIGRGADLAFYSSFVIVAYVLFRIVVRMDRIERDITKIVRHIALHEGGIQNPNSKNQNDNG